MNDKKINKDIISSKKTMDVLMAELHLLINAIRSNNFFKKLFVHNSKKYEKAYESLNELEGYVKFDILPVNILKDIENEKIACENIKWSMYRYIESNILTLANADEEYTRFHSKKITKLQNRFNNLKYEYFNKLPSTIQYLIDYKFNELNIIHCDIEYINWVLFSLNDDINDFGKYLKNKDVVLNKLSQLRNHLRSHMIEEIESIFCDIECIYSKVENMYEVIENKNNYKIKNDENTVINIIRDNIHIAEDIIKNLNNIGEDTSKYNKKIQNISSSFLDILYIKNEKFDLNNSNVCWAYIIKSLKFLNKHKPNNKETEPIDNKKAINIINPVFEINVNDKNYEYNLKFVFNNNKCNVYIFHDGSKLAFVDIWEMKTLFKIEISKYIAKTLKTEISIFEK